MKIIIPLLREIIALLKIIIEKGNTIPLEKRKIIATERRKTTCRKLINALNVKFNVYNIHSLIHYVVECKEIQIFKPSGLNYDFLDNNVLELS